MGKDESKEIDLSKPPKDLDQELEILPNMIAFVETQLEEAEIEMDGAKIAKDRALSECMLKYQSSPYVVQKAMYKKTIAEENEKIMKLKEKFNKAKIEFNRLKNRFQSVRKIASMRMEEMRHLGQN